MQKKKKIFSILTSLITGSIFVTKVVSNYLNNSKIPKTNEEYKDLIMRDGTIYDDDALLKEKSKAESEKQKLEKQIENAKNNGQEVKTLTEKLKQEEEKIISIKKIMGDKNQDREYVYVNYEIKRFPKLPKKHSYKNIEITEI